MNKRPEWIRRMKAVELEYGAAAAGLSLLSKSLRAGVSPGSRISGSQVYAAQRNLEVTYLIRLYAVFEAGLRDAWQHCFFRRSRPKAEDLVNAIGAYRSIGAGELAKVHSVRLYRNSVVHEGAENVARVSLDSARASLCRFFSWLPLTW